MAQHLTVRWRALKICFGRVWMTPSACSAIPTTSVSSRPCSTEARGFGGTFLYGAGACRKALEVARDASSQEKIVIQSSICLV